MTFSSIDYHFPYVGSCTCTSSVAKHTETNMIHMQRLRDLWQMNSSRIQKQNPKHTVYILTLPLYYIICILKSKYWLIEFANVSRSSWICPASVNVCTKATSTIHNMTPNEGKNELMYAYLWSYHLWQKAAPIAASSVHWCKRAYWRLVWLQ